MVSIISLSRVLHDSDPFTATTPAGNKICTVSGHLEHVPLRRIPENKTASHNRFNRCSNIELNNLLVT